ncbi:vWA containing CoxE family protein [Mycobacterium kansasii]|uniref:VWA containing CoxE family protein n=1 Tax=Mycobacterium kansasii TaxID=1768 RepID=A0A1V3XJL6_MYCKA|nr:vWA containing CoxE family protein [Mycobacterium kansasii]
MATRRIRPTRPLAPHGLPGHLVGFVEALRAVGISVGPSETVDAGRVMATLGLGDRDVLREGIACAVLRRPDHRETYDAMFDLWFPAALGARAAVTEDDAADDGSLPPDDVEAMRQLLLDLLTDNPDLADMDERLVAMIARIVEAYGKYSSSRGPSFSSYQALKAMALDELEGKLLAGLLAPYGDEPTPTQEQIAKALAAQRIAQLRKLVDAETKRRTAEQLGRDHVQMYGIPQLSENVEFLRASGEQLRQMRRVVARWPARWRPGWRHAGAGPAPDRSTCERRCASRCPPAASRSTWCCANRARPVRNWLSCATFPVPSPGSVTSRCCWSMRCANSFPEFGCSPSSTPPTK